MKLTFRCDEDSTHMGKLDHHDPIGWVDSMARPAAFQYVSRLNPCERCRSRDPYTVTRKYCSHICKDEPALSLSLIGSCRCRATHIDKRNVRELMAREDLWGIMPNLRTLSIRTDTRMSSGLSCGHCPCSSVAEPSISRALAPSSSYSSHQEGK